MRGIDSTPLRGGTSSTVQHIFAKLFSYGDITLLNRTAKKSLLAQSFTHKLLASLNTNYDPTLPVIDGCHTGGSRIAPVTPMPLSSVKFPTTGTPPTNNPCAQCGHMYAVAAQPPLRSGPFCTRSGPSCGGVAISNTGGIIEARGVYVCMSAWLQVDTRQDTCGMGNERSVSSETCACYRHNALNGIASVSNLNIDSNRVLSNWLYRYCARDSL